MPDGFFEPNTIYCGDCKDVLAKFPVESVDLIYIDPPFFSNRKYEVLWGDGYELRAFEDRWKGGIENYISWMEDKLRECYRILRESGSIYLHCDWHANAHLRLLLDSIFGESNFRNEIIWHYTGRRMKSNLRLNSKHDTIFYYAKSKNHKIVNYPIELYTKEVYLKMKKQALHKDQDGREWIWGHAGKGKSHNYKIYIDEVLRDGRAIDSVWDIPIINTSDRERLGYPTQKPEKLLERIINTSTKPTDIVLDPMCGCGTAIAVAYKMGRRWIGIDVSPTACKLMVTRMRKLGVSISDNDIIGLPRTLEEIKAMQPYEFQNWVCECLFARVSRTYSGDYGIDGWLLDGRPLQVKQSENIGRNPIDNFETAIRRANKSKGIFVALSFGKGAYEEVARARLHDDLEIELKTAEELLSDE